MNNWLIPIAVLSTALRCPSVLNLALPLYIVWSAWVIRSVTATSSESGSVLADLTPVLVLCRLSSLYHFCHLSETVRYMFIDSGVNPLDNPPILAYRALANFVECA